jgi:hypothetical protein
MGGGEWAGRPGEYSLGGGVAFNPATRTFWGGYEYGDVAGPAATARLQQVVQAQQNLIQHAQAGDSEAQQALANIVSAAKSGREDWAWNSVYGGKGMEDASMDVPLPNLGDLMRWAGLADISQSRYYTAPDEGRARYRGRVVGSPADLF